MSLSHSPKIVTDGLVLCLDAASKRSYPGTGTTWTDLQESYNGTLTNGPAFDSANKGSISFDGSDDYIQVANSTGSAFNLLNISVGCWFKTSTTPSSAKSFVSKISNILLDPIELGFELGISSSNGYLYYSNRGSTGYISTASDKSYTDGNWHYAVGINDDDAGLLKMYVDGAFKNSSVSESTAPNSTGSLYIGAGGALGFLTSYTEITIASVHIYNRVLGDLEVRQNYLATRGRYK